MLDPVIKIHYEQGITRAEEDLKRKYVFPAYSKRTKALGHMVFWSLFNTVKCKAAALMRPLYYIVAAAYEFHSFRKYKQVKRAAIAEMRASVSVK